MSEPLLEVRDLSVVFRGHGGTVMAVRDVSFDLFAGETLALVGESGSGKSVTANAVLQIVDPPGQIAAGQILLRDDKQVQDIASLDSDGAAMRAIRAQRIAMVFQEPMSALSPVHSCGRQVLEKLLLAEPGIGVREARRRIIELFERVELPRPDAILDSYPFEISGGQRQRIVIAMAIAGEPDILIADEPTTALDVTTQAKILNLLNKLKSEMGMAMLFVTHDMSVVAQLADRMLVMRSGKTIEVGAVSELFRRPTHEYTTELIDATQRLEQPSPLKKPAKDSAAMVLSVSDLSKTFVQKTGWFSRPVCINALCKVNLSLRAGESLGVVGESGSGKSTLLRCLLGLTAPSSGQATYRGADGLERNLTDGSLKVADPAYLDLRMIFQDPWSSLNPRMTVFSIVAEPLRLMRRDFSNEAIHDRVVAALSRVGIGDSMLERYPHAFSGGQRQRIVIARAMVTEPRIIFADEATSALDISLRATVLDLLLELQSESGAALLFVTHDIAAVRYFCDRAIVMQNGAVVEEGAVDEVLRTPQNDYTRSLIRAVPRPDPAQRQNVFSHGI